MKLALAVVVASSVLALPALADPQPQPQQPQPARSVYKFDVSITGIDAQPATYAIVVEENERGVLSSGANVQIGNTRQELGLQLKLSYSQRGGAIVASGDFEMSNADQTSNPVSFHKIRAAGSAAITGSKPALLASVYDPQSKKRYEVSVTATKMM